MWTKLVITTIVAAITELPALAPPQNDDTCQSLLSAAGSKPAVCVSTPFEALTINRTNGRIHFYLTFRSNNAVKTPLEITVSVSAAGNPSGVQLTEGQRGVMKTVRLSPGSELKDIPIFFVATDRNNRQSGRISYTLTAHLVDSSQSDIEILGVPFDIDVKTNP